MPDAPHSQLTLAAAVRQIREREGITQEELAVRTGFHLTWISRMESGRYDPGWQSLRRVAEGLGITALELVALSERIEID